MPITAFNTLKYPTTTSTANGDGIDGDWINPANIFSDNASNATSAFFDTVFSTLELNGGTFGMGVPTNAVIDGIKAEIEVPSSNRWATGNSSFRLKKAGTLVGDNKIATATVASGIHSMGGPTDLWGTTWTPAEVNASNFGFGFVAGLSSSPNDFSIAVDFVRITVYWHYSVDVSPADVPKKYVYKVFNNNAYLGNLPSVISKFGYALDINSVGSAITIVCGVSADTSGLAGDRFVTQAGDPLTDEAGNYLYTEGQPAIIGAGNSLNPYKIQNGNRVEVWEYSYYHPNGKLMFKGQVNRIEAGFGSAASNSIKLMVLSDGLDLDNYIARGSPFNYTADVTQTSDNSTVTTIGSEVDGYWNSYGQTWVVGAGVTKLGAITIKLNTWSDVIVRVYDGLNGSLLGTTRQNVNTGGASVAVQFGFSTLVSVTPGNTYFFSVFSAAGESIDIRYSNANPYANGKMYNSNYGGGSGGGSWTETPANSDLYFIASSGVATTTATYTSKDPSTEMLKPIIDDYRLRGGVINYSASSVDATGLSLTATFNTETILDAIKKVLSLAPNGFYFYVDLGTNTIYFKNTLATTTHRVTKGKHLHKVDLILSIERVKNDVLFSGGATAGVNLYSEYIDQASKGLYGQRLERKSDNRVTVQETANAIGNSYIQEFKDEYQETTITVLDRTADITLYRPGQTVGLRGFGTFIDKLRLQIVRVEYLGDSANLTLGNLPMRFTNEFENIVRGLVAEQTIANPSTPS